MKKSLFFAVFSVLALMSFAQNPNDYEDVVYLKNGNIYRGTIIEQIPNVSLKIQSQNKNVFAVQSTEIEKITKEEKPNNFYHGRYFAGRMDRPDFEGKAGVPTKLSGFYMNWGLGVGGSENNGFAFELSGGRKIFGQNPKRTGTNALIGTDVFGFVGGIFGQGSAVDFGVNIGPSFAWKLKNGHKGIIFLTPYSGINVNVGKYIDNSGYYDNNGNFIPNNNNYRFTTVTFPVGLKFEYNYKKFICGMNASFGVGVESRDSAYFGAGAAGRLLFFVGIKF